MKIHSLPLTVAGFAFFCVTSLATTRYVDLECTNPLSPYTSWATAATNIQDAIEATIPGDIVLVTNGVYDSGGRVVYGAMTNRVAVTRAITVQSVNGPAVTAVRGYQVPGTTNGDGAIRCVYLTNGAALLGFTLTSGATRSAGDGTFEQIGGGVWCESTTVIVSNCVITRNSAVVGGGAYSGLLINCLLSSNSASGGGGAFASTLTGCMLIANSAFDTGGGASDSALSNCTLVHNWAGDSGGGASQGTLDQSTLAYNSAGRHSGAVVSQGSVNNCVLVGNSAGDFAGAGAGTFNNCTIVSNTAGSQGGGVYESSLLNCIVFYNTAPSGPNHIYTGLDYSCSFPADGTSFTNPPIFVDLAGGNLRLQTNSPCINSGTNGYVTAGIDLDGRPRIIGGTVDVGAYEFQGPGMGEFIAWLQGYALAVDGSADYTDTDSDLHNNWQEWRASTVPTNALSVLHLLSPSNHVAGVTVTWQSVSNVSYFLQRSIDLGAQSGFTALESNLVGQAGMSSYTDTNPPLSRAFYRVGVQ